MKKIAILALLILPFYAYPQINESILASGDWYKISVSETGIYKITYDDLISYGLDPDQIDPRNLALFGNSAGMLSEIYSDTTTYAGLSSLAIKVEGEDDGVFDTGDYILFYGQSPVTWNYDAETKHFHHQVNYYTDKTCYFLTVKETPGKRIQLQPNSTDPYTAIINEYDLFVYHELDSLNLLNSGKRWLGETFTNSAVQTFNISLSDYMVYPSNTWFNTELASHSFDTNYFNITINNSPLDQIILPTIPGSNYYQAYRLGKYDTTGQFGSDELSVGFEYNSLYDSATAWLDYFELNLKAGPYFYGNNFGFRTTENIGLDSISYFYFNLNSPENFVFWNVTDPLNVSLLDVQVNEDGVAWFQVETETLQEFYGFNGSSFYSPQFVEEVENQDLLTLSWVDFVIVTHSDFESAAESLASFHQSVDGFTTAVVTTDQVYNEFSTGSPDVTAIRNFVWFLKEKSPGLGYVLLFGDASYDYKDRIPDNTNFVPTWESFESANMVHSFSTDRYFSVQDMFDQGSVEQLALGRMPVSTLAEANAMVAKIQTHNSTAVLGPWKNETMFIADDGDQNRHQADAEILSELTTENSPFFNINKNYLDFYTPDQTDEGPRIPEVTAEIDKKMNEGVFYVNFTGHGGPSALTAEKVLTVPDLSEWSNKYMTPLWVIASGDVARYDNPELVSLGEEILLQEEAGAISVISSSNLNFASANLMMNYKIVEKFTNVNLQPILRYGDLYNNPILGENYLKWTFLGDPALKIPFPPYQVKALQLNGQDLESFSDTISPGSTLTLTGQIIDRENAMLQNWFNGTVHLKVFAPAYLRSTVGNQSPPEEIPVQDSVIAQVTADVENGEFEISVTLPSKYYKDYGKLKLSWYAENGETDANGYNNQPTFGGEPNGLNEFDIISGKIKAYPTPFSGEINLELPESKEDPFSIAVYDLLGVQQFSDVVGGNATSKKINLDFLPKGIYMLNIRNSKGSKSIKILKK